MKLDIFFQLLILSFCLLFVSVFEASGQSSECKTTLTDEDTGNKVCLRKGDKLCLQLKARLATGFSWKITKNDSKKLKLISESTEKTDEDEATIELQIFTFEAVAKGSFLLEISYARPWEKDKPPEKKYVLDLKIK